MVAREKEDLKSIQDDVSTFLSSLGLSSTTGDDGSGFNDVDFRKTGRIKPVNDDEPEQKKQKKSADSKKKEKKEKEPSVKLELKKESLSKTSNRYSPAKKLEKEKKKKKVKLPEKTGKSPVDDEDYPAENLELKEKDTKKKKKKDSNKANFYEAEENFLYKSSEKNSADGRKPQDNEPVKRPGGKRKSIMHGYSMNESGAEEYSSLQYEKDSSSKADSKIFSKMRSLLKSAPWFGVLQSVLQSVKSNEKQQEKRSVGGEEEWNDLVNKARRKGEELIGKAAIEYEKLRGKDSDMRWLMIARKTGTTADKVAALTVLLQDDPISNIKALDSLLGMVTSKGGKRHAAMGMDALKELFTASLLPDWKLKYLTQQSLQQNQICTHEGEKLLFLWYWEDCLKQRYEKFVDALEEAAKDKLPFLKEKAVKTIYELLKSKPEQERKLLRALVNKLGDPERKIASNAGYYLSCLLSEHPNMKMVVIEEVDSFLFRPHMSLRSRYQAAVFLNQIVLSNRGDGPKLAKRLIDIYLSLFKVITTSQLRRPEDKHAKKKGCSEEEEDSDIVEIDSRLLSALLTGVNRAFPYVAADDVDTLVEEHTPIIFRLVHSKSFNVGVQALMLLYQLLEKNNVVSSRLYRALYAVLLSPSLPKSTKLDMFLSLVFKAIKSDISSKRMAAFSKRLMQVALQGAPQFACGCLLLLSEVLKSRPSLWHAITQPEDGDEEVEKFKDVDEDEMVQDADEARFFQDISEDGTADKACIDDTSPHKIELVKEGQYNMRHRDPSYCNADRACWWELTTLASHAHPSVAAMAKTLLSGASILYAGDPLRDLALGVFLDRFTEKKPKSRRKCETWHGSSLSTPSRKASTQSHILPVGAEFLELTEGEVAPEDIVFHKFYITKANRKGKTKKEDKMKEDMNLDNNESDLVEDESDDEEIEDLLELEEGKEMGLDDVTDDENDSEGEWILNEAGGVSENNVEEEDNSSGEDTALGIMDLSEDDIPSDDFEESGKFRSSKEASTKASKKKRKQEAVPALKGKRKRNSDGSKKSPFASFEEYSHMLDMDDANTVPNLQKSKHRKPETHI